MLQHGLEVSPWDATMFPGTPDIRLLSLNTLRQCAGCARGQVPLHGLYQPPPGMSNMSFMVVGMVPDVPGEIPDHLEMRRLTGDLGLQINEASSPLVFLPPPVTRSQATRDKASQCVTGLVQLLQRSVPNFWRGPWNLTDLNDFLQDSCILTSDAVTFLTGVLRFAVLIRRGVFPHDAYLAWVWASAQRGGKVWL